MRFPVVLLACLALAPVQAQSHLVERSGPFVSLDLAGGPFPMFTPAGVDVSGGIGYRLGRADVAFIVGYGGAVADTLFPYPAEWHLGSELAANVGPSRRWRLAVAANVSIAGSNTFAFPVRADGSQRGPTELRGGSVVTERRARATVTRYVPLVAGRVQVLAGAGVYGAVRNLTSSTLIFRAGSPDETVVGGETVTETSVGVVATLPVVLQIGERGVLVLEPELRLDANSLFFGVGDGQITLRLNL